MSHDSLFYLTTAENINSGEGIYWSNGLGELKPLSHFPPFYPLTLSVILKFGISLDTAVRFLGTALYGANIIIIGLIIFFFTRRCLPSLIAAIFLGTSPVILWLHLQALSEPIFFLSAFAGLAALANYASRHSPGTLLLAASLIAIAGLSRYAGTSLIASGAIGLFLLINKGIKERVKRSISFGVIASAPLLLWAVRNFAVSGSFSNRMFGFHPVDADTLRRFLDVVFNWFWPGVHSHWIEISLIILFFLSFSFVAARNLKNSNRNIRSGSYFVLILLIFMIVYSSAVIVSLSFFDASTRIDDRILSPLFIAFVLSSAITIGYTLQTGARWAIALGLVILLIVGPLPGMLRESNDKLVLMKETGYGFTNAGWRNSEVIEWIRNLQGTPILATDEAMAVHFFSGVRAYQLPERMDPVKQAERPEYGEELRSMLSLLNNTNSYLVLFGDEYSPFERTEDFMDYFDLVLRLSGAEIYTFKPSAK